MYMANFLSRLFGGGSSAPAKAEVRRLQDAGRLLRGVAIYVMEVCPVSVLAPYSLSVSGMPYATGS